MIETYTALAEAARDGWAAGFLDHYLQAHGTRQLNPHSPASTLGAVWDHAFSAGRCHASSTAPAAALAGQAGWDGSDA